MYIDIRLCVYTLYMMMKLIWGHLWTRTRLENGFDTLNSAKPHNVDLLTKLASNPYFCDKRQCTKTFQICFWILPTNRINNSPGLYSQPSFKLFGSGATWIEGLYTHI